MKALVYSPEGQPYLYNLDLMYFSAPKLDLTKTYYVIFTPTTSAVDSIPAEPTETNTAPMVVKVSQGENKM